MAMARKTRRWAIASIVLTAATALSVGITPASADAPASTTLLSVSNPSPAFGSAVTLQTQVSGTIVPTGPVTFSDGLHTIGSALLGANGLAQVSVSTLSVGPHSITASYAGDADNTASVSTPVTVNTVQRTATDLLMYSLPKAPGSPKTPATPVVFVANVIKARPLGTKRAPTGTVTFNVNGLITTLPVTGLHHANLLFPNGLPLGTYTATARYDGDPLFTRSISPKRTISVLHNLTRSISDSPDPVTARSSVTYAVTVTNNGLASATGVSVLDTLPTGTTLISATAWGGCTGTGPVSCALGTLAVHASATATIVVQVPASPPPSGTITNTATALLGLNKVATETTSVVSSSP
jgi:uncharacterized repeat protein (TIGR01451 family)